MADARVIGIDGRTKSTANMLAGADRASGERARRRTTPLLPSESAGPATKAAAKKAPAIKATPAAKAPAKKAPARKAVAAQKAPAQKAPAKKAVAAQKAPAQKAPAKNPPPRKAATKQASAKVAVKRAPAQKAGVTELPAVRKAVPSVSAVPVAPVPPPAATRAQDIEQPLPPGGKHSIAMAIATQIGEALLDAVLSRAKTGEIEDKVASILSFARRRLTGDYELDEFGFDPEFTEKIPLALLKPLYKHWFRVEVRGIENIPAEGGALVVANHSGALPLDAVMTAVAVHEAHPQKRFLRTLGADLLFQTPFLAGLARRAGSTLASNPDAEKLLSSGHLVGVWPEGFKGIGKPFRERYKLQRFGRGGFVSAALRTGTPIIPCSIVGAEEIYPIIGDIPSLARLLGLPYIPITPFFPLLGPLGAIPLPSKWLIEFGPPVVTSEYGKHAADDPMLVFDLTDQVRQSIQQTLYSLLVQRRSIFF